MFLSYILFELLDVEHGSPISHKNVKEILQALRCLVNTITPGNFVHSNFLILHYLGHKIKYISSLRMAALACNITLRTLPAK